MTKLRILFPEELYPDRSKVVGAILQQYVDANLQEADSGE